jgi:hypothetical protein
VRIYLSDFFLEVRAGTDEIHQVLVDSDSGRKRFYIEAGRAEEAVLAKLGLLEHQEQDAPEPVPEAPPASAPPEPVGKQLPESYVCKLHKGKTHKQGTSAYVTCFDANFPQVEK